MPGGLETQTVSVALDDPEGLARLPSTGLKPTTQLHTWQERFIDYFTITYIKASLGVTKHNHIVVCETMLNWATRQLTRSMYPAGPLLKLGDDPPLAAESQPLIVGRLCLNPRPLSSPEVSNVQERRRWIRPRPAAVPILGGWRMPEMRSAPWYAR